MIMLIRALKCNSNWFLSAMEISVIKEGSEYVFNMKTVSVRMYTFHNCENYVKVSHDCPTKRDGSSFKTLVMQQSSRNIKVAKI